MAEDSLTQQSAKLLQAMDFAIELAVKEEEHQQQMRALLLSLLDVIDSFDRFFAGMEGQTVNWLNTVRLIARQLEHALNQAGLTPIACLGQKADPPRHEIVEVKETFEAENDVIVEVVSRGYEWNGQLLRRPQVVVAHTRRTSHEGDRH